MGIIKYGKTILGDIIMNIIDRWLNENINNWDWDKNYKMLTCQQIKLALHSVPVGMAALKQMKKNCKGDKSCMRQAENNIKDALKKERQLKQEFKRKGC